MKESKEQWALRVMRGEGRAMSQYDELLKMREQRDELVAALELLLHETGGVRNSIAWDSPARGEWLDRIDAARDKARAILAKVKP